MRSKPGVASGRRDSVRSHLVLCMNMLRRLAVADKQRRLTYPHTHRSLRHLNQLLVPRLLESDHERINVTPYLARSIIQPRPRSRAVWTHSNVCEYPMACNTVLCKPQRASEQQYVGSLSSSHLAAVAGDGVSGTVDDTPLRIFLRILYLQNTCRILSYSRHSIASHLSCKACQFAFFMFDVMTRSISIPFPHAGYAIQFSMEPTWT